MSIGALTRDTVAVKAAGEATFVDLISLVGDDSYPTGGSLGVEAALKALVGDGREILSVQDAASNGARTCRWDYANKKLLVFAAGAEVANATDLSGTSFKLLVTSR